MAFRLARPRFPGKDLGPFSAAAGRIVAKRTGTWRRWRRAMALDGHDSVSSMDRDTGFDIRHTPDRPPTLPRVARGANDTRSGIRMGSLGLSKRVSDAVDRFPFALLRASLPTYFPPPPPFPAQLMPTIRIAHSFTAVQGQWLIACEAGGTHRLGCRTPLSRPCPIVGCPYDRVLPRLPMHV